MECSLALKRKERLPCAATCADLGDIMLGEISQTQKGVYCMIPLRAVQFIQMESRKVVAGGSGGGVGSVV